MRTSQEKALARETDLNDFTQDPLIHLAEGPKHAKVLYGKYIL